MKAGIFLIFIFLFISAPVIDAGAQGYSSPNGFFKLKEVKGCNPFTVEIFIEPLPGTTGCPVVVLDPFSNNTDTRTSTSADNCKLTYQYTLKDPNKGEKFNLKIIRQGGSGNFDIMVVEVIPNLKPEFNLSTCNGSSVEVKVTDAIYDEYFVDFDFNGTVFNSTRTITASSNPSTIFNYSGPGNRQIAVRGKKNNAANNCDSRQKAFTAVPTLSNASIIDLKARDASTLQLTYDPAVNTQYKLDIAINGDGPYGQLKTLLSSTASTTAEFISEISPDEQYYCLQLRTYDPCTNTSVPTGKICSLDFDLSIKDDVNQLKWNTSSVGNPTFNIKRNDANLTSTNLKVFDDSAIVCNTDYKYLIEAVYPDGSKSLSLPKTGKSQTAAIPDALKNFSSVTNADGKGVSLSWVQPTNFTALSYYVSRSLNNGPLNLLGESPTTDFTDSDYSTEYNLAYRITYVDACIKNSPPGRTFSPLVLSAKTLSDSTIALQWNQYRGYENGVASYTIEKTNSTGGTIDAITISSDSTYIDSGIDQINQKITYRIVANPLSNTLSESFSNDATITLKPLLIFPTAFVAKGTAKLENKTFRGFGRFIRSQKLQVFDRWGTLQYSGESKEGEAPPAWDGTNTQGATADQGVYVWKSEYTDYLGKQYEKSGSVNLIHKK